MAWQVWLQCGVQIARLTDQVCFVAQGGDPERNAASDWKPVKIMKELLTCVCIANDSSKPDLDYLQLIERHLSGTM